MERKHLMKQIVLAALTFISALFLTTCGGKTDPVITKADPTTGIYLGGTLPGISEEVMQDPKVKAESIAFTIPTFSGSKDGFESEEDRLIRAWPKYVDSQQKMIEQLNAKVAAGDIAGYRISKGDVTLYTKHGIEGHMILN